MSSSNCFILSLLTVFIVLSSLPQQVDTPSDTNTVVIHPMPAPPVKRKDDTEIRRDKLFEGDILLVAGDKPYGYRKRRSEIMTSSEQEANIMGMGDNAEYNHTWPNNRVYYTFAKTLDTTDRAKFKEAMIKWEEHTCIEFQLAPNGEMDHLVYIKSDDLGCSSYVGRKGGLQLVTMSDYCFSLGHAIHVSGHAIGLWHEHSRPDRDTYIDVLYDNIIETETDNFGKLSQEKFELVPDVGYDVESIMHYGPYAFSKNDSGPPKETIRLREDAPLDYKHCTNLLSMGQHDGLSYLDKLRANKLYSCRAKITLLEAQGRDCVTPAPTTTTTTTTTPTTTMPEPTPSTPSITPSPPQRLKSGSVITLRLEDSSSPRPFADLDGLKCTPTCRKTSCIVWGTRSSCDQIDHRFEIVMPEDPDAKKIKSGAKVALRSKSNPTQWLDCSSADGACSISRCMSNNADSTNASITTCGSHYFKIIGVGRREGRLINSNHSIQLRHEYNESYLNCNAGDKRKLSECVDTCEAPSYKCNILK